MSYLESLPRRMVTVYVPLGLLPDRPAVPVLLDGDHDLQAERGALQLPEHNPFWINTPTLDHIKKLLFETAYPRLAVEHHDRRGRARPSCRSSPACSPPTRSSGCASAARSYVGLRIFLAYLVPPSILFIPLADHGLQLGLFDTPLALILTYPTFLIPFCTWLLIGYFKSIPYELEECALIDGATRLQILRARSRCRSRCPGLISAGIFAFTLSWNEFIYALAFISVDREQDGAGRRS